MSIKQSTCLVLTFTGRAAVREATSANIGSLMKSLKSDLYLSLLRYKSYRLVQYNFEST